MTELFSTDKRRKAGKRILRLLQYRDIPKSKLSSKLARPVKVRKEDGQVVELERIYNSKLDAKKFVKEAVQADNFPVEFKGNKISRTDLSDIRRNIKGETA